MPKAVIALVALVVVGAAAFFFLSPNSAPTPPAPPVSNGDAGANEATTGPKITPLAPREIAKVDVRGRVADSTGAPRAGVTVRLERGIGDSGSRQFEEVSSIPAGERGEFAFSAIPVGRYRFSVSEVGFATARELVVLAEGVTPPEIELILTPGAVIEGTLRDDLGNPLAGATVVAFDERGTRTTRSRIECSACSRSRRCAPR